MALSLQQEFALLDEEVQAAWLAEQDEQTLKEIARKEWWWESRPEQVPPETAYFIFLYLAGRGTGKTRSGSEWIVERALRYPFDKSGSPTEHLVVAESLSEARRFCVEGPSGILKVLTRREVPYHYTRSPKPKIVLTETGARIFFEGADNPDCGRGGNNTSMWLDEIVTWKNADRIWAEGLMPSLRADIDGDHPRCFITTTPKPLPFLRKLLARTDGSVAMSRGSTFDNAAALASHALKEMRLRYEGTKIGRQELYGEMLDDMEGALFSASDLNAARVTEVTGIITSRAVAIDPSLTGDEEGDEMGVVVAVRDERNHIFVLEDASEKLVGREAALHSWRVFARNECDVLIYENNLGHAWLHQVLVDAYRELQRDGFFPEHTNPPLKAVRSYQGKQLRAEPVAMRAEQGRIHMVGRFEALEQQLVGWDPLTSRDSPDRLDAFVHVCRHLMEGERGKARIVSPTDYQVPSLSQTRQTGARGHATAYIRRHQPPKYPNG